MAKSKAVVLATAFKVLASFGCSSKSSSLRQPNASCLRLNLAHMAKSKQEVLLEGKASLEENGISLRSSEST